MLSSLSHTHMLSFSLTHTLTKEYHSDIKKKKILPFATTWMNLEGIMLSKINQTEKDKYCMMMTSLIFRTFFKKGRRKKLIEKEIRFVVTIGVG